MNFKNRITEIKGEFTPCENYQFSTRLKDRLYREGEITGEPSFPFTKREDGVWVRDGIVIEHDDPISHHPSFGDYVAFFGASYVFHLGFHQFLRMVIQ